jgi:two-component sensor histidine kinase
LKHVSANSGHAATRNLPAVAQRIVDTIREPHLVLDSGSSSRLLRLKDILLDEIYHRVANSLQIIASIISMKVRKVTSDEARRHLEDTHDRVISITAVQNTFMPRPVDWEPMLPASLSNR